MEKDIRKDYNVFLTQLKPLVPDERNSEVVIALQEDSIKEKICGMGWAFTMFFQKNPECKLENHKTSYKKDYILSRTLSQDLNRYDEIEEGDYILTRLHKTSMCYVGKVKSKAYHSEEKLSHIRYGENYSWIVDVEWKEIGLFINIPNALRGIMQTWMKTIKKLDNDKNLIQKQLVKRLFEESKEKIKINRENFVTALDALDLEDLVAKYILKENPGYMLIPSSCKSDEPTFEFKFVNDNKAITCQVKNDKELDCKVYNELPNNFEKIYLFSGKGIEGQEGENVKKIEKGELFDILKEEFDKKQGEFYNRLHQYYTIED